MTIYIPYSEKKHNFSIRSPYYSVIHVIIIHWAPVMSAQAPQ